MANQASSAGPEGIPDYHTVFIDTSLDTHLIIVVSSSETFSDLKKKVLYEHALCFPHIGEIKIHGLKVKRRGKFYYLSESMLVKSVFHGVNKSWFISVDASRLDVFDGNRNFVDPLSNNLLTSVGTMNIASDNAFLTKSPRNHALLTNGDDQQIDPRDQNLGSDVVGGDGSKSMEMGVKLIGDNCGEAKRVDGNGESSGPVKEKGDHYEKEIEINNTSKEGPVSIIEGGIFDKSGSMPLEERAAEATPVVREDNHKPKRKKKQNKFASEELNAEVPESGMHTSEKETEKPDNYVASATVVAYDHGNVIDEPGINSSPEAKEDRGTVEERVTIQSKRTDEKTKVVELNNAEPRENNPQTEPLAKRKRKRKQENEGDQGLLKDDGTLVSKSNEMMLEHSTISQKSLVAKQHGGSATLDNLSNGDLQAVHLDSTSPSKKRVKKKKSSTKTSNQEATVDPSHVSNEGVEHSGMHDNSNLGEKTGAVLAPGRVFQDATSSEPGVPNEINQRHKQGETTRETNLRPNSLETVSKNKEVGNLEDEHEASAAANGEREFTLESAPNDIQLKAKETVAVSEPFVAGVNVDPPKSSKKRKKSTKANDLANKTPSASVTEHVEAFASNTAPTEANKEESDRLPKDGKEIDTMSTSILATDKEINDVIQNVVDSVQKMGNDQVGSESIHGKSKKRSKKKQKSDAKLLPESTKQDENAVLNNAEQTEYSSEVTKQKLMESEKLTGDVEVLCEGSGINFYDYFTPKKHNPENVGPGEMPVDQTTVNAKKKTKNKKRDRHSETPSSEINTPPALDNSHGVIAKPLTGGSSSAEVRVPVTKANSEKTTLQLNQKHPSDKGTEPPVSSKSNKVNSVPESNDVMPSGVVNASKNKRAESNLKSSKHSSFLGATVNGHQSLKPQNHKDGGKPPSVKSLVGLSGSIFKDDSDQSSSNEDIDSGSSTRTPSDASLSSDYSDGESNAVSPSRKREEGGRTAISKPLSSEMSLHKILRSSSRYKKAKITASQSQLEDTESEPIDTVPETQA